MLPLFATNQIAAFALNAAGLIWAIPEVYYSYKYRVTAGAKTSDRGSGVFLVSCIWLGAVAAYWFTYAEPGFFISEQPIIFSVGILLIVTGVAFRWYAIRVLGKYFNVRVTVQPEQRVVREGPYRLIRHPSYTGSLITLLGLGLAFTNWLSLLSLMIAFLIGYGYRVHVEETVLVAELGQSYVDYMKHTKRFIPFVY